MTLFRPLRPALLGFTALLSTAAHAQTVPSVQLTQPDAISLSLRLANNTGRPARLFVIDVTRNLSVLDEAHYEPAYGTLLKFDALPSGRYLVAVHIGRDRYRYTVEVDAKAPGTTIAVRETSTHRVESGLTTAAL
jgi:hypothetical protein